MIRGGIARAAGLAWLSALSGLAGCGVATSGLDVRYSEAGINRAALASVPPRRVEVNPVVDRRVDATRIGSRPPSGEPIATSRPPAAIVEEALVLELRKNGHTVAAGQPDVRLAAEVEEFGLDIVGGYSSTLYVGRVIIALTIASGDTGAPLLTRRYVGAKRRLEEKESSSAWREVMDTALSRAMHDLATDPEVAAALGGVPAPIPTAAGGVATDR